MPPVPGFLVRAFSHLGEPSSKRTIAGWSSVALCVVFLAIGSACAWWIFRHGDLGLGAAGSLTFSGGLVAALAGIAYRKPDGAEAPSAPDGVAVPGSGSSAMDGGKL
jgi:hypothetical protein